MAVIEAIETVYLEADAASVTFASLGSYEHLQLRFSIRSTYVTTNHYESIYLRFATGGGAIDTGTNYSIGQMYGTGAGGTGAGAATSQTGIYVAGLADTAAADYSAGYGQSILDILDYRNPNKNTTISVLNATASKTGGTTFVIFASGLWDNTGAVDKVQLIPYSGSDFVRGSEFTLYGLNSS